VTKETLIEFPAEIKVKAMGLNSPDFADLIQSIVQPHVDAQNLSVTLLPSKAGKYLSVSACFTATSLEQLHQVYAALRAEPRVLYTL